MEIYCCHTNKNHVGRLELYCSRSQFRTIGERSFYRIFVHLSMWRTIISLYLGSLHGIRHFKIFNRLEDYTIDNFAF